MAEKKPDKTYPSQFDKVKEITDKLEAGIQALFESEAFKNYLKTLSKFHDYSLNNTILIAMQKPDATLVAGYTAWQKNFGRQVQKGETGIRILAPTPYKKQMEVDRVDPVTKQPVLNPDGSTAKDLKEIMVPAFKVVNPDYLTVDEAALQAKTSTARVYKWISAGRFPVLRFSKMVTRIPRKEFEAFLEENINRK